MFIFSRDTIIIPSIFPIIKTGLGFRPLPPVDNVESTLIWYKGTQHENYKHWTDSLDDFLAGKFNRATSSGIL